MKKLVLIFLLSLMTGAVFAQAPTTAAQMDEQNQQLQVQIAALRNQLTAKDPKTGQPVYPVYMQWVQLTSELEANQTHARTMHYSENVKAHEAARKAAADAAAKVPPK